MLRKSAVLMLLLWSAACGQQAVGDPDPSASDAAARSETVIEIPKPPPVQDKRVFGVLPNYRTADGTTDVEPLTSKEKLTIAAKDSFDWPSYITAFGFAGMYQLQNSNPSFGQGLKGYSKRYGTAVGDQIIGNMLTEGIFSSMLHEDPRYFRKGSGGFWARFGYAATRTLVTRTDSGRQRFNYSEVLGNATAAAISNAYYPDSRDVPENLEKLGLQIGTDTISNILKEFWPDFKRKFMHK